MHGKELGCSHTVLELLILNCLDTFFGTFHIYSNSFIVVHVHFSGTSFLLRRLMTSGRAEIIFIDRPKKLF